MRIVIAFILVCVCFILDDIRSDLHQNNDYLAKLVELNGKK